MNDNIDVLAHLDDGRVYSFLVSTPNNLYRCMENEQLDYYWGIPPVFVVNLTRDNIERALNALISDNSEKWLKIYGTLQKAIPLN